MKYQSQLTICMVIILFMASCNNDAERNRQQASFQNLSGPYFGLKPPGIKPVLFAPGFVSTGHNERCAAFTLDGREFFYCLWGAPHGVILHTREIDGHWTEPQVADFSRGYPGEVSVSPRFA